MNRARLSMLIDDISDGKPVLDYPANRRHRAELAEQMKQLARAIVEELARGNELDFTSLDLIEAVERKPESVA